MTIDELLAERELDIDDVRYYLSHTLALELLSYRDDLRDLVQIVWSGELATRLYDMEEKFIRDLQEQLDGRITDEAKIKELLSEIDDVCSKRYQ